MKKSTIAIGATALVLIGGIANAAKSDDTTENKESTTNTITISGAVTTEVIDDITITAYNYVTTTEAETTTKKQTTTTERTIESTYVLNTSTMKAHLPTCNDVKNIKEKNYSEFSGTTDELKDKGYSPCGHCHPW